MDAVIKSTIDWQKPAQAANQYNVGARSVAIPCKTAAKAQSAKDFFRNEWYAGGNLFPSAYD